MSIPIFQNTIGSIRIIEDLNLTETQEREILIRRKNRGLVLHHWIRETVPSRSIYRVGNILVMHPIMAREIRQGLELNPKIGW